ncbi:acyltransferase [Arthrobacter sp. UYCu712]|uniref:acyltransferase family protein n=1 Tax=Arthrobacter sp. UYCu712 TaxID=3156340 RepID=UPI003394F190
MATGPRDSPPADVGGLPPLHVLWNGTPAVHVFFVLSGFVLVLPFTRPGAAGRRAQYYAKRFFRLYLPAWASLAVAVALIAIIPRSASPLQSPWADMYETDPSLGQVLKDGLLLLNASTINTPLWSLKWEVLFSLLLPAYVLLALRGRRFWHVKIGLALLLPAVGALQDVDRLSYLPVFAIGAVLGTERERIRELTQRWPRFVWFFVAAAGIFLANAEWISPEQPIPGVEAVVTVGATLIVLLFVSCRSAKRLGDTAGAQWLGRLSFSLYLVHLSIILAGVTLLRSVSLPLALAVSVGSSLVIAELFYRYVEQPSHRLSMAVGRAVGRRTRRDAPADSSAATPATPADSPAAAPATPARRRRRATGRGAAGTSKSSQPPPLPPGGQAEAASRAAWALSRSAAESGREMR